MPKQNKKFQVKTVKLIFQPAWLTRSMQVWLDLVLLCQTIFSLPEADESEKRKLMVQVGKVFLADPPEGHRVALPGAAARKQLVQHCQALDGDSSNSIPADLALLR